MRAPDRCQHSQSPEGIFTHVSGLKTVIPSTPYDAKGLLIAAIEDPDPVMFYEHKLLYKSKGPVPEGYYTEPIGKAALRRVGRDVTIVATSMMAIRSLEAAALLEDEGIDVEVIDWDGLQNLLRS